MGHPNDKINSLTATTEMLLENTLHFVRLSRTGELESDVMAGLFVQASEQLAPVPNLINELVTLLQSQS